MAKRIDKGTMLGGRFRLDELIGGGGMGSVYAARDLEQGYRVAVKVLDPRLARNTEFRERFLGESRVAARIPHPHILTVFDHGEDQGWHYLAMRLVETDLGALIQEQDVLEPIRALNIADQVAWALDVAHDQGLVHRDVKPENVLVSPRRTVDEPDQAYLCDFGIAKLESARANLTRTGVFMGTVSYASPEQTRADRLDGRSDQYSLACVLFETLTGDPPFTGGDSDAVMASHRDAARPRVSEQRPELPAGLDGVVARGMATRPEDRFPSCRAMVAAARQEGRALSAREAAVAAVPVGRTVVETAPAGAGGGPGGGGPPGGQPDPTPATAPAAAAPPHSVAPAGGGPHGGGSSPSPPSPPTPSVLAARRSWPGRHPLATAMTAFVAVVTAAVVLAAVVAGGEETSEQASTPTSTDAPGNAPAPPPPPSQDRAAAERAIRQTVEAYAAAEGEQGVCATLTSSEGSSCETTYATAQPARYEIQRVELADEEATVQAAEAQFGDPMEFELVRVGSRWLIDNAPSFAWKTAEEVEAATVVERFGRAEQPCDQLSRAFLRSLGGRSGCERRYGDDEPLQYDLTIVALVYGTGSVSAQVSPLEIDGYQMVEEGGQWKISGVN